MHVIVKWNGLTTGNGYGKKNAAKVSMVLKLAANVGHNVHMNNASKKLHLLNGKVNIPEHYVEKFWSKVDTKDSQSCWEWKAGRSQSGYGIFSYLGKDVVASRMAYCIANGGIPESKIICHKCDNPPCCNPNHLYAGTFFDNYKDSVDRKRLVYNTPKTTKWNTELSKKYPERYGILKGESHGRSVLTKESGAAIRKLKSDGNHTLRQIAKMFNVSRSCVCHVIAGRCWKEDYQLMTTFAGDPTVASDAAVLLPLPPVPNPVSTGVVAPPVPPEEPEPAVPAVPALRVVVVTVPSNDPPVPPAPPAPAPVPPAAPLDPETHDIKTVDDR